MIDVGWQIRIERSADEIFDFVADLHNEPQFNPDASNIVRKTDGPIGRGTVYEEDFKRIGHYVTTIDVYDRPHRVGFDARNPRTDAVVRFRFDSNGPTTTDVTCELELTMKGFMRFLEPLMAPTIRKQITSTRGPMLKAALERT
jgi:Polyketide cyclase / dehydrase and lipid transport